MNQPIHFVGVDVTKDTLHTNYQTVTDANNQPQWHYQIIDNLIPTIEEWAGQPARAHTTGPRESPSTASGSAVSE